MNTARAAMASLLQEAHGAGFKVITSEKNLPGAATQRMSLASVERRMAKNAERLAFCEREQNKGAVDVAALLQTSGAESPPVVPGEATVVPDNSLPTAPDCSTCCKEMKGTCMTRERWSPEKKQCCSACKMCRGDAKPKPCSKEEYELAKLKKTMAEVKEKLAACKAKRVELAQALKKCEAARKVLAVSLKACLTAKAKLAACHKARDEAQAKWDKCEEQKKTLNAA